MKDISIHSCTGLDWIMKYTPQAHRGTLVDAILHIDTDTVCAMEFFDGWQILIMVNLFFIIYVHFDCWGYFVLSFVYLQNVSFDEKLSDFKVYGNGTQHQHL